MKFVLISNTNIWPKCDETWDGWGGSPKHLKHDATGPTLRATCV